MNDHSDAEPKKVDAEWSLSLDCTCPHCGEYVDLVGLDDIWEAIDPCEHNTPRSRGAQLRCPECNGPLLATLIY